MQLPVRVIKNNNYTMCCKMVRYYYYNYSTIIALCVSGNFKKIYLFQTRGEIYMKGKNNKSLRLRGDQHFLV